MRWFVNVYLVWVCVQLCSGHFFPSFWSFNSLFILVTSFKLVCHYWSTFECWIVCCYSIRFYRLIGILLVLFNFAVFPFVCYESSVLLPHSLITVSACVYSAYVQEHENVILLLLFFFFNFLLHRHTIVAVFTSVCVHKVHCNLWFSF